MRRLIDRTSHPVSTEMDQHEWKNGSGSGNEILPLTDPVLLLTKNRALCTRHTGLKVIYTAHWYKGHVQHRSISGSMPTISDLVCALEY